MNRKQYVLLFVVPSLRYLALWLRTKDENSIGIDDALASTADTFIEELEKYLMSE